MLKLKDPNAVLDFGLDWAGDPPGPWLAEGEEITSSTWTVPAGLTKDSESNTTTVALVWLSGGTVGQSYTITNHIVTNQARTEERSIQIVVRER